MSALLLSRRGQQNLQRSGLGRVGEDVVRGLEFVEAESVRDHRRGVEPMAGDQTDQRRSGIGVDQAGGDGQVLDPDVFQMQGRRRAVHTDVGDVPAGTNEPHRLLERLRKPDSLHRHISAQSAGQFTDHRRGIVAATVDHGVGAELARRLQPGVGQIDRHDMAGAEQARGHDRRQPDGSRTDDRDDIGRDGPRR